jgi:hypothetical protein
MTTNSSTFNWNCSGSNGGSANACASTRQPAPINGQCGSASGGTTAVAPSSSLCAAGSASSVATNTSTYNWNCSGSNGGSANACSSNRQSAAVNWQLSEARTAEPNDYVDANMRIYVNNNEVLTRFNNGSGTVNAFRGDLIRIQYFYIAQNPPAGVSPIITNPRLQLFLNSATIDDRSINREADSGYNHTFTITGTTNVLVRGIGTLTQPPVCTRFSGSYSSQPATSANGCVNGSYNDASDDLQSWKWSCTSGTTRQCVANRMAESSNSCDPLQECCQPAPFGPPGTYIDSTPDGNGCV